MEIVDEKGKEEVIVTDTTNVVDVAAGLNITVLGSGGLKCDNPECDFRDDTIPTKDYEKWINAPCPLCGDNLLTQEDYDDVIKLLDAVGFINSLSSEDVKELSTALNLEGEEGIDLAEELYDKFNLAEDKNKKVKMSVNTHKGINIVNITDYKD